MGMLKIWHRTQLLHQKCIFTKIQDGGGRHLEFRKSVAISIILDQSSPNLIWMLRYWQRMQLLHQNCIITKIQDGGGHHLKFRKSVAISLLFTQTGLNVVVDDWLVLGSDASGLISSMTISHVIRHQQAESLRSAHKRWRWFSSLLSLTAVANSASWRLMPYDVWNNHTWKQTRGIWSESKSIIHYNIKPRMSKCEWITYSRLLRVDQVAPPAFEPVNNRFRSRRANHSATAPHNGSLRPTHRPMPKWPTSLLTHESQWKPYLFL